ncbi:MAG: hypothetical protein R3C03_10195 [Pirellulaceae bacterium]
MNTMISNWNDPENQRSIKFMVRYRRDHEGAEVLGFEPMEVSFWCKHMENELRRVRIHTAKGRLRVADQIRRSGKLNELVGEIQSLSS